jgi:protein disulfide-isomerase A1
MRLLALALLTLAILTNAEINQEKGVYVLTDSNFNDFINDHEYAFLLFYSPWCSHCKKVMPEIAKLAKLAGKQSPKIAIGKVDITSEVDLSDIFGIEKYPTFKFFVRAEPIDYEGGRTATQILSWVKKRLQPTALEIVSIGELETLKKEKLSALMITTPDRYDVVRNFEKLAITLDGVPFRYTYSDEIRTKFSAGNSTFIVFKGAEETYDELSNSEFFFDDMKEFFHKHRHSLIVDFDKHAGERIFGNRQSTVFLISDSPKQEHVKTLIDHAKRHSSELVYSHATFSSSAGKKLAEFFELSARDDPTAVILEFKEGRHVVYRLESGDMDGLGNFLDQYTSGSLTPYYKSEPIHPPTDAFIKTIVGKSFDDLVLKNDNYILLKIHAPWCQHSKALAPIYTELAYKLREVDDLVIAEMDGTANEHPALKIEGFPTILLFKRDDKDHPVEFKGARLLKNIVAFLEEELGRDLSESEEIPIDSGL